MRKFKKFIKNLVYTLLCYLLFMYLFNKCNAQGINYNNPILLKLHFDDKAAHFYAGAFTAAIVNKYVYKKTHKYWKGFFSGWAAATIAGAAKEYIFDGAMNKGVKSNLDFIFTCYGGGIGSEIQSLIIYNRNQKRERKYTYSLEIFEN